MTQSYIGALGEVLAQQPVGVLVGATLPGRVRVAEVDVDVDVDLFQSRISGPWSQFSDWRSTEGRVWIWEARAAQTGSVV
jgi:hypothetical protein